MLGLRTAAGISPDRLGVDFAPLEKLLLSCESHGLAQRTETGWRLTPKGFLVSNAIIGELLDAME